jgi:hypothetical protein
MLEYTTASVQSQASFASLLLSTKNEGYFVAFWYTSRPNVQTLGPTITEENSL